MSALKRSAMPRKRTKPRRVLQVCSVRGCKRRADQAMCKSHAKLRADQAWSRYIRNRDGRCMAAEAFPAIACAGSLQAMHLISRRYAATRYQLWNGRAGCAAHHRWLTDRPLEHDAWCQDLFGDGLWSASKWGAMQLPPMSPIDFLASPEATAPTEKGE